MSAIQSSNLIIPGQMRSSEISSKNHFDTVGVLQATCTSTTTHSPQSETCVGVRRVVYIALAGLFFALGMIGIVLPGLPTTPFMLLTSYFLARSWPSMHRIFLGNKLFGPILRNWQQHRAVEPRVKLQAAFLVGLAMAWLLLFSSLPFMQLSVVLAFASFGLFTIYLLPTVTQTPSRKTPSL